MHTKPWLQLTYVSHLHQSWTTATACAPKDVRRHEARAMSIDQFCNRMNISRSLFYKMSARGAGPRTFKVGGAVRISVQAAQEWLRQLEAESDMGNKAQTLNLPNDMSGDSALDITESPFKIVP